MCFFFNDTATTEIYTLSLHDALPICALRDNPPSGIQAHEATRPFDMQVHKYNMSQPDIVGFIESFRDMLNEYPGTFTVAEVGGPNPIGEIGRAHV